MADCAPYWQEFRNEPHADFSRAEVRQAFASALKQVEKQLGKHYPLIIGGKPVDTPESLESVDPGQFARLVGTTASASEREADVAVAAAHEAWLAWASRDVSDRANLLRAAADIMTTRRYELAAWQVFECAKGWREADGDVTEAIDFLRYYASGAEFMWRPHGVDVPGEENRFSYQARGVAAVIAPWNFPLAILTGMTAAALATGNTVVMKPAEQSPVMAAKLMEVLTEAGIPAGVANYLPGRGETCGARLVEHEEVDLIAFTGSRPVGLRINERAAATSTRRRWGVKKVIAELGGKNAIIIDEDADLDEAVAGVVSSAFGYQGQKCSACSRAIAVTCVYDAFLERLVEATRSLPLGPGDDPGSKVGPVIDQAALNKVRKYIEIGQEEGREVLAMEAGSLTETGYYVGPHIFADVPPTGRLAQEEVFGPVLAVMEVADLDEAFQVANGTDYALTGGFYSRNPENLQRAEREFVVGNLYLNRSSTGARVGRQPFGGFRLSGIGSKAGGPDYLLQYVVPKTVTENTMRRGFAPPD